MNPLISIIVPVYNLEQYVSKCIKSILNQSYRNLEVILVDDGSTDSSLDVLQFYEQIDARILLLTQKNSGVSIARNNGLRHVTGEYVMFVDGDDWISADMVQYLYDLIQASDFDMACCGIVFEDEKTSQKRNVDSNFSPYVLRNKDILRAYLRGIHLWSSSCARLYKTSFLKQHNLFFPEKQKIGEDGYFTLQLMTKATSVIVSGLPLYYALVREVSATRHAAVEMATDVNIERFKEFIVAEGLWLVFHNDFKAWYVRAISSNLFHLALKVSYPSYKQYYEEYIKQSEYLDYNTIAVRKMLNFRNHVMAILGKYVWGSYYSMALVKKIKRRVLV